VSLTPYFPSKMRDYEYQQLPVFDPESPFKANQNPEQPPVGPGLPLPQSRINRRLLIFVWSVLPFVAFVSASATPSGPSLYCGDTIAGALWVNILPVILSSLVFYSCLGLPVFTGLDPELRVQLGMLISATASLLIGTLWTLGSTQVCSALHRSRSATLI
jgi:hypothetical protein